MLDTTLANAWLTIGESRGRSEQAMSTLIAILEAKFGRVTDEIIGAIQRSCATPEKLRVWATQAATAVTLAEFRAVAGI